VVDGVSFAVHAGEVLGLVGESGSGKTLTALSILRLVPNPPARIVGGRILLGEVDLLALPERALRHVRGRSVAMVFQEPMTSLNPVLTIGEQIAEVVRVHEGAGRPAARNRAVEMLRRVRIPDPERRAHEYPHQLSGGMRQRAMLAMALAGRPRLLIADEPTTALDVTVQAQIVELLRDLQAELELAILWITHDLVLLSGFASRLLVMYAGRIVEEGPAGEVLHAPRHPYTEALLRAMPQGNGAGRAPLETIPGTVPDPGALPAGCAFAPRCGRVMERCHAAPPPPLSAGPGRQARCYLLETGLRTEA
jgi:oligopeptide/dipeptide ABC transporter ATP-binding protein